MTSGGIMRVRMREAGDVHTIMNSVHSLWEAKTHLDGLMVCRDGCVPFSRLILASHSPHLRDMLITREDEDVQKIILADFR